MKNQSDRKIFWKFILIILVCGLLGGIAGGLIGVNEEGLARGLALVSEFLTRNAHWIGLIIYGVCLVLSLALYHRASRLIASGAVDEDEEVYQKVDRDMNLAIGISSICVLLSLMCFGLFVRGLLSMEKEAVPFVLLVIIGFLIVTFSMVFFQTRIVRKIKVYAPEKRGNALDFKFDKEWLDSSDEAEKLLMYSAGYQTFRAMNKAYGVAMIVVLLLSLAVDMGVIPVIIVGLMWAFQVGMYVYQCIRLSRKKLS